MKIFSMKFVMPLNVCASVGKEECEREAEREKVREKSGTELGLDLCIAEVRVVTKVMKWKSFSKLLTAC